MPKNKDKDHAKPTTEDLDAKIKEAEEAIEAEKSKEDPKPTPKEPVEKQADPSEEAKDKLKEEIKTKDKKLSASAKENQKIYAKNRVLDKAIIDAEEAPEPTTKELKAEYDDWDVMSDTEKKFAKETVISRNWRDSISKAKEQTKKIVKWEESVSTFINDPKTLNANPELEGKGEAFKKFASEETNNSVPFRILVGAFLHENSSGKTPNKGAMFPSGTGGIKERSNPKGDKVTLEEARAIRKDNYAEYKKLLNEGKIEMDI